MSRAPADELDRGGPLEGETGPLLRVAASAPLREAADAGAMDERLERVSGQERVQAQLLDQLYERAPLGIFATVTNSAILVFILWGLVAHWTLLAWFGTGFVLALVRYGLIRAYRTAAFKTIPVEWWRRLQVTGLGLSGTVWGAAGLFLFPRESTAHQAFIAFVLAGMVAGAAGTFAPVFPGFVAFSLPALAPIFVRFLIAGDDLHTAMSLMTLLFGVLTFLTARHINASATELLTLKEQFAEKVAQRTEELISANRELSREIADRQEAERTREQAEGQIRAALREKEVLLKEIHHRVKNNLAVIVGILKMQSSRIRDPRAREAFQDCYDRVTAMALIHEALYQSEDLAAIPLAAYARELSDNLVQMMLVGDRSIGIQVVIEAETVQLPIDEAMPCGLILNELLTNALKYAFADRQNGRIVISAQVLGNGLFELVVKDNGVGLPAPLDLENPKTLGFRLISTLVRHQMEGTWQATNEDGACIRVRWPSSSKRGGPNEKPT
jgi:two-component sensor histidine kinase